MPHGGIPGFITVCSVQFLHVTQLGSDFDILGLELHAESQRLPQGWCEFIAFGGLIFGWSGAS